MPSRATAAEGLAFSARWNSVGRGLFSSRSACRCCAVALSLPRKRRSRTAPPVAIIDEVLAKKLWPEGDALGQQIQFAERERAAAKGGAAAGSRCSASRRPIQREPIEIVGIVPDDARAASSKRTRPARFTCRSRADFRATFSFVRFAGRCHPRSRRRPLISPPNGREVDPVLPVLSLQDVRATSGGNIAALDRARGRGAVLRLRRARARARGRRHLRRESLLGRAADARDRHPHGAGRAAAAPCSG